MAMVTVNDYRLDGGWTQPALAAELSRGYCEQLEQGKIIKFDTIPFVFPKDDIDFLLSQKQSGLKVHKNVSYRPMTDVLRGDACETAEDNQRLQGIMRRYSQQVTAFLEKFLAPYAGKWALDYASYRPVEEQNRDLPLHKRNDLMHVDAFPSRPTFGARILRVFTNINPTRPRIWETTEGFNTLVEKFGADQQLTQLAASGKSASMKMMRSLSPLLKMVGIKGTDRSAYDRYMLRFHDFLKENTDYQTRWEKIRLEFPPGSAWMVYTDQVPHAALSGQFALEQTYIIPVSAMVAPQYCPLRVLENHYGVGLAG